MPTEPHDSHPHDHDPVVYRYTRQQAIDDGVLVDLTPWAKELGFTIPVACTAAVWHEHVVPPVCTRHLGQSERGRGHDLLWMLACAIRGSEHASSQLSFETIFLDRPNVRRTITFKAICGPAPGNDPPPEGSGESQQLPGALPGAVMTILLPHED